LAEEEIYSWSIPVIAGSLTKGTAEFGNVGVPFFGKTGRIEQTTMMWNQFVTPDTTVFILLSFEGPDSYSLAGGLGVRVAKLAQALAEQGYETHLCYVGDPEKKGVEASYEGRLIQHRWCQWISRYHPCGVYDGEEGKLNDYTASLPDYVVEALVRPRVGQGQQVVIMAEEWHTAEAACRVNELLQARGLKHGTVLLWNANNTFCFSRINWPRLKQNALITTVSRYMRHLMQPYGVEPLVIPNGIQRELIQPVEQVCCEILRREIQADLVLFKMARFDPAKGWVKAMETAARLKAMNYSVRFFVRGGVEPYGKHVLDTARSLGLSVKDIDLTGDRPADFVQGLLSAGDADVANIRSFLPHGYSKILFSCSDAVLADSLHEPFGLVGLEAMASGGAVFVGRTGEDYARDLENSVVLETSKSTEATASVLFLKQHMELAQGLRARARSTAQEFTWDRIINGMLQPKLQRIVWEQRVA